MMCTGPQCDRQAGATTGLCESHRRQVNRGMALSVLRVYGSGGTCPAPGVDGQPCGDVASGRGWCIAHTQQMRRRGEVSVIGSTATKARPQVPCRFDGCGRRATAKGLCASHRNQERAGRPLAPLQVRVPLPCTVTGCDSTAEKRGMCGRHYVKSRHVPKPRRPKPATVKAAPAVKPSNLPAGWFNDTVRRPNPTSNRSGGHITHDTIGAPVPLTDQQRLDAALRFNYRAEQLGATITERRELLDMLGLNNTKELAA